MKAFRLNSSIRAGSSFQRLMLLVIFSGVLAAGCNSSSERQAQSEALAQQLQAQREELNQLRSKLAADRQRIQRTVVAIELYVEDLDRTLDRASAEIWGDGSSTGAHLSTARRSLDSLEAEVNSLVNDLLAPRR
jgi:outer membrane murein-binding lipoprotein Lpp